MRDYNSSGVPARKIVHLDMGAFYASVEQHDTGGKLTVSSSIPEHGPILIAVSDQGIGLSAAETDQVFEGFFIAKPKGTGLGLSISRSATSKL